MHVEDTIHWVELIISSTIIDHLVSVVMKSGVCWSFGSNSDGQLGVGRGPEWSNTPVPWEVSNKGVLPISANGILENVITVVLLYYIYYE